MPAVEVLILTHKSASLNLALWEPTRASFADVYATERNQGHATNLLNELTRFADDRGMTLVTGAQAYGDEPRLSTPQLVEFYKKFGFVALGDDPTFMYMEREPR